MRDKIFVITLLSFLLIIPLVIFIKKDKEISIAENRSLFKKSDIKISNLNNDLERYLQDQFVLGERLKKIYNIGKNKIVKISMNIIEKSNFMDLIPMGNDLYRISNSDYIVYRPKELDENIDMYKNVINNINKLSEMNPDINFYMYNIVTDHTLKNREEFDNFIKNNLNKDIKFLSSTKTNSYEEYKNGFYKTDHHWNKDGQYDGYTDIMELIGISNLVKIKGEKKFENIKFYGSKARLLGSYDIYDEFVVNEYEYPKMSIEINYKKVDDYGNMGAFFSGEVPSQNIEENYYADYYGLDDGIIKINVEENSKKENILIFSNSYSNPLNKLIASSFFNTYIVDLRSYELENECKFSFNKFVNENDIDKVLIIGNYNYFINQKSIIEY